MSGSCGVKDDGHPEAVNRFRSEMGFFARSAKKIREWGKRRVGVSAVDGGIQEGGEDEGLPILKPCGKVGGRKGNSLTKQSSHTLTGLAISNCGIAHVLAEHSSQNICHVGRLR